MSIGAVVESDFFATAGQSAVRTRVGKQVSVNQDIARLAVHGQILAGFMIAASPAFSAAMTFVGCTVVATAFSGRLAFMAAISALAVALASSAALAAAATTALTVPLAATVPVIATVPVVAAASVTMAVAIVSPIITATGIAARRAFGSA
jgi:hypothetical protein